MKFSPVNTAFFALSILLSLNIYSMDNQADLAWDEKDENAFELPQAAKTPVQDPEIKKETPAAPQPSHQKRPQNGGSKYKKTKAGLLIEQAQQYRHDESKSVESVRDLLRDAAQKANNKFEQSKAYQVLGKTYVATDAEQAIKLFKVAIKLNPNYPDNYFSAGDVAGFALKDFDKAINYFEDGYKYCVAKHAHKKTMYFASLGKLYVKIKKDCEQARHLYQQAVTFCQRGCPQELARFERLLGNTYRKLNQNAKASAYLSSALSHKNTKNFDESLTAYASYAKALRAMGKIDQAKNVFQDGLAFSKTQKATDHTSLPSFYKTYALFFKSIGETENALRIFEEGIVECKDTYAYKTSQLYKHYGIFLEELGKLEQAQRAYKDGYEHAKKRKPEYCKDLQDRLNAVEQKMRATASTKTN